MNWRWLIALPIAAFLCGNAVHAPRLQPPLPESSLCPNYAAARERYLLSYAYKKESPARSQALLEESKSLLNGCEETLRNRQHLP